METLRRFIFGVLPLLTFAATAEAKLIRVGAAGLLNQVPVHVTKDTSRRKAWRCSSSSCRLRWLTRL
jgi:hypothetical protein